MRIIDNDTGKVENGEAFYRFDGLNDVPAPPPDANQIANFFGVPIKWVFIAGLAFIVLPMIFNRGR